MVRKTKERWLIIIFTIMLLTIVMFAGLETFHQKTFSASRKFIKSVLIDNEIDTDLEFSYTMVTPSDIYRQFLAIDPEIGPLDEYFDPGQSYYFDIGVVSMWSRGLTGIDLENSITIAVIDSGVDLDHPDIDDNLVGGFDFIENDSIPQDMSTNSHGSMVAGIIAAEINNEISGGSALGIAGVGGGDGLENIQGLQVMPIRIGDPPSCQDSVDAINYAVEHDADVINISYGGEDFCQPEYEAIQDAYNKGLVIIAGAGNNDSNTLFYPAAYGYSEGNDNLVIAVAGVYKSGTKANASNYGEWIDIVAPVQVYSLTKNGGYAAGSGTSFSAPFVSGILGVLMSNYDWSRDEAITILKATADSVDSNNPAYVGQLGAGRVNADQASLFVYRNYLPAISN